MVSRSGRGPAFLMYADMGGMVSVMHRRERMKANEGGCAATYASTRCVSMSQRNLRILPSFSFSLCCPLGSLEALLAIAVRPVSVVSVP